MKLNNNESKSCMLHVHVENFPIKLLLMCISPTDQHRVWDINLGEELWKHSNILFHDSKTPLVSMTHEIAEEMQ